MTSSFAEYSRPDIAADLAAKGVRIGDHRCPGWMLYQIENLKRDAKRSFAELPELATQVKRRRAQYKNMKDSYWNNGTASLVRAYVDHTPGPRQCHCLECISLYIMQVGDLVEKAEEKYRAAEKDICSAYKAVEDLQNKREMYELEAMMREDSYEMWGPCPEIE